MNDERRNFFRLDDRSYLEYRCLTEQELGAIGQSLDKIQPPKDGFNSELEQVNRSLAPLLATLRNEVPGIVQCLEVLNRKIDIIAGLVLFERLKNESGDACVITTTSTIDLSEGGASFETEENIAVGTQIYLKMMVLGARFGIETYAVVVHQVAQKSTNGQTRYRLGIEFPMIAEPDRKLLARYILDRQREQICRRNEEKAD